MKKIYLYSFLSGLKKMIRNCNTERIGLSFFTNLLSRSIITATIILIANARITAQSIGISDVTHTPAASAVLDVYSASKGMLVPNVALTSTTDATTITSPATSLLIYNTATAGTPPNNVTPGYYYNTGTTVSPVWTKFATGIHSIGESYGGGIVFYVYDGGQHGLIAATADQGAGIQWYNGTNRYTGTTGDGLNAGAMNTAMIVATQMADNQTGNFAAKVCADYSVTVGDVTYGDWYLPSKYELNLLYLQKNVVSGFVPDYYWSSTEYSSSNAWSEYFGSSDQYTDSKTYTNRVRAIRAF